MFKSYPYVDHQTIIASPAQLKKGIAKDSLSLGHQDNRLNGRYDYTQTVSINSYLKTTCVPRVDTNLRKPIKRLTVNIQYICNTVHNRIEQTVQFH